MSIRKSGSSKDGTPTVQIFLVNHPKAHRLNRQVTTAVGGAPPSPTLLEQMKALNIRPIHLYGLTETYGPYIICEWHVKWDTLPLAEQARLLARQGQSNVVADPLRVVVAVPDETWGQYTSRLFCGISSYGTTQHQSLTAKD